MANPLQTHAVHTLYSDHQGWLHTWLWRKIGNRWDAADLVHDSVSVSSVRQYIAKAIQHCVMRYSHA